MTQRKKQSEQKSSYALKRQPLKRKIRYECGCAQKPVEGEKYPWRCPKHNEKSKFGAIPSVDKDGTRHDSKGERDRWFYLKEMEDRGQISGLQHHPKVTFLTNPTIGWTLDSSYVEDGRVVFEDYKPRPFTDREVVLMKLWIHFGPAPLRITKRGPKGSGFALRKSIVPNSITSK